MEISLFPGRRLEAKRRLYQEIGRNLSALGTPPNDIFIVLHGPPMESWLADLGKVGEALKAWKTDLIADLGGEETVSIRNSPWWSWR